jgi:hypothetical protein
MRQLVDFLSEAAAIVADAHRRYDFAEGLFCAAVDTVAGYITNQTSLTAWTMLSGDTLTVRNFPQQTSKAYISAVGVQSATKGKLRIYSPLLHDNTTGLTWGFSETPAPFLFPREVFQQLQPQDVLTVQQLGGGAESDAGFLSLYYENLPGATARLFNPSDIKPRIKSIKVMEVDVTTQVITSGWKDTAINATEDTLHANTDYAVLGYDTDTAVLCVAFKGVDTGNLRIGGPGPTASISTGDYFWEKSLRDAVPHIPVFNSANKAAFFLSSAAVASAATVFAVTLAELYAQ